MNTLLLLGLCAGVIAGAIIGYLIAKSFVAKNFITQAQHNALAAEATALKVELAARITKEQLQQGYVVKELFTRCSEDLKIAQHYLQQKEQQVIELISESEQKLTREEVARKYIGKETYELVASKCRNAEQKNSEDAARIIALTKELAELKKENENLLLRFTEYKTEIEAWHLQANEQFKNLANDILKEKSKDFVETNRTTMDTLLNPLKTDISTFKKTIEDTRKEDIQDITSLKKEIEALQKLNTQLSDDAQRLAGALKSDVKVQGNWGEDRLKFILEAEGLQRYIDFTNQGTYKDDDQEVSRRPDFIINLPDGKHIVVDSKVSLNAYVEYFNSNDEGRKRECVKQLVRNINDHIDGLSAKNYHSLNGLNSPDFVCLFMHFEAALSMAMNENPDILQKALNKKVVLLTPTTLVATAKMIKLIWQKENRVKNVEEIFKQCGLLYDKFVLFVEDFQKIGESLHAANTTYGHAMDRLKDGRKKGDTILGRFENIKSLDAKTNKSLPAQMLNELEMLDGNPLTISLENVEITPDKALQ